MSSVATAIPAAAPMLPGRTSRPLARRGFVLALAASVAVHLAFTQWPVDLPSSPQIVPLQATITELPPPPKPVASVSKPKPKPKPRRANPAVPPPPVVAPAAEPLPAEPALLEPTPEAIAAGPELPTAPVDVAATPSVPIPTEASDKTLPPRVDLVYKGYLGTQGFVIGDATYRFEHSGNRYRISSVGELRGLAALFYPGQGKVESRGSITAAGLQPYEFTFERSNRPQREIAVFDWEAGVVTLNDMKTAALEIPTFDWLAIMWQYYFSPPSGREVSFSVATTRRVARYTIRREEDERIEWGQGEIDTVRWHRTSEDGRSDGYVWLAPSLRFIPVKIRHHGPRGTFEALLQSIRVDESPDQPAS